MKSMMIALTVMIAGLSTGCAQIDYLQDPANYRVNELNGSRMYCHGDSRDNYTPCEGFESKEQIAQREAVAQAKAAENAAWLKAENEREMETAKEAAKLQAIEYKKRAMAEAAERAYAASPAGKLKAKREAEAQAKAEKLEAAAQAKEAAAQEKRDAAAMEAIFGKTGIFGAQIERYNNMTPEQRQEFQYRSAERRNAEFQQRSRESSARQQAYQDRNVFCHRNYGRSC